MTARQDPTVPPQPRLTREEKELLIEAAEFVLAGERDDSIWTEAAFETLARASDKLKMQRYRRPS